MSRIDVVLPVKNGERFIGDAIRSIQAQSVADWRLRVVDHASTDTTPAIVEAMRRDDPRIELHHADPALTLAGVRDFAFTLCDAPFVMLHDHDDISMPSRMADQLALFERIPRLVLVGGSYDFIDEENRTTGRRTLPTDPSRLATAFLFNNPIAQPAVMLRFDAFNQLGLSYSRSVLAERYDLAPIRGEGVAQDYLLFGQLAVLGLCGNVDGRVLRYRRHGSSISATKRDRQVALSHRYARHFMELVAAEYGVRYSDPIPFSNFAAEIVPVGEEDLPRQFRDVKHALIDAFGDGRGVRRELAFRQTLTVRGTAPLLARFARFAASHWPESDEIATMRTFVSTTLRPSRAAA